MKLVEKVRVAGKIHRKYDQPKTPYQRLIESGQISATARKALMTQYESLNVAALRRRVEELRNRLFDHLSANNCVEPSARKRHGPYSCWRSGSCNLDEENDERRKAIRKPGKSGPASSG
jgi:hypothetical protein